MKLKEIEELMFLLEANKTSSDYVLRGENIWPIIRKQIYFGLVLSTYEKSLDNGNKGMGNPSGKLRLQQEVSKIIVLRNWIKIVVKYLYGSVFLKSKVRKLGRGIEGVFLFQTSKYYTDLHDERLYSRYVDPYYDMVKTRKRIVKLHVEEHNGFNKSDYFNEPHQFFGKDILDYYMARKMMLDKIGKRKTSFSKKSIVTLVDNANCLLEKVGSDFKLKEKQLSNLLDKIWSYEDFAELVLQKLRPKVLFVVAYYEEAFQLSFIRACKKNGVRVVDIQHGKGNVSYEGWQDESRFLPDLLWVWSQSKFDEIDKNKFLKPVLGGNLWLKKYKDSGVEKEEIDSTSVGNRIILVSLEAGFTHLVMPLFKELLIQSPENWQWKLRFHPMTGTEEKDNVIRIISQFPNVEYEKSTSMNLYDLLNIVDFQITALSTTSVEGLEFEVPCVIVSEAGKHSFRELIDKEVLYFSQNANEVITLISDNNGVKGFGYYSILQPEGDTVAMVDQIFDK